jgi:predicted site-specific integrase-resolvase
LNKRGIRKIITSAIEGKINELMIAYRDRLTRFGYELIEELVIKYSQGRIKVINEKDKIEPETELVQDVMAILNVYTAKMNGLRRYRKKVNKEEKP